MPRALGQLLRTLRKHEEKRAFDIFESHFLVLSDTRKMHVLEVSACLIEYASFWLSAYASSVLADSKVDAILLSMDAVMLLCSV